MRRRSELFQSYRKPSKHSRLSAVGCFTRSPENDYSPVTFRGAPAAMAKATVTIKDVAREALVSVATVSRALNGRDNVAEGVRRHVVATASRLRYQPHAAA
jgi:hypothetical protein